MTYLDIISLMAIAVFSCILIYFAVRLVGTLILEWSNLKLKLNENEAKKRETEIRLRSKEQQASYVMPNEKGVLPIPSYLIDGEWIQKQYEKWFHNASGDSGGSIVPTDGTMSAKVQVPDFFQLWQNDQLPKEKFLLGYNVSDNKPVEVTFDNLRSTLIGGQTDSGKSTLVRLILVQAIMQGAKIAIIDPHAAAGEESLSESFYAVAHKMYLPTARTIEEQLMVMATIEEEFEKRINGISQDKTPLVLVVDETNSILANPNTAQPLERLLDKISNQARKIHIYAFCIGQNFHGKNMPTTVRNNFVSILSTYSRRDVARTLSDNVDFSHLAEDLKVGQCLWMKRGVIQVLNVPNVTSKHVALVTQAMSGKKTTEIDGDYEIIGRKEIPLHHDYVEPLQTPLHPVMTVQTKSSGHVVDSSGKNIVDVVALDDRKMRLIVRMLQQEKSATEIITTVFQVDKSGAAFQSAAVEYRKYLAEIARRM